MSLQTVRKVYQRMAQLARPPLVCQRELFSDGKIVFTCGIDEEGQEEAERKAARRYAPFAFG